MDKIKEYVLLLIACISGALPFMILSFMGVISPFTLIFIPLCMNHMIKQHNLTENKNIILKFLLFSFVTIIFIFIIVLPFLITILLDDIVTVESFIKTYTNIEIIKGLLIYFILSIIIIGITDLIVIFIIKVRKNRIIQERKIIDNFDKDIKIIKNIFEKNNAYDKESAISLEKIKINKKFDEDSFNRLYYISIIKKYKKKYYFSIKAKENYEKNVKFKNN